MKTRQGQYRRRPHCVLFAAAAIVCAGLALVPKPAPAAVTIAHMLFDDEFKNVWKDGSWKADVDPKHAVRVYNGAHSLEVTLKGKGALAFAYDKGWNITRYTALVGWIHGGSEGAQNVRLVVTNVEGTILPGPRGVRLATPAHIQGGEIVARQWQFFVVPLSQFKLGYKDTTRIVFYNPTQETMPTFYLDDVGLTTQRVQRSSGEGRKEERPAVRPKRGAHRIYTDGLRSGWQDWSWDSTVNLANTRSAAQGRRAIHVRQKPNGGLAFGRHDAFSAEGYKALEFYIHGGRMGGQKLRVALFDEQDKEIGSVFITSEKYLPGGRIAPNLWQQVYIPLADLGATTARLRKIAIINAGGQQTTYAVDAVSLVK